MVTKQLVRRDIIRLDVQKETGEGGKSVKYRYPYESLVVNLTTTSKMYSDCERKTYPVRRVLQTQIPDFGRVWRCRLAQEDTSYEWVVDRLHTLKEDMKRQ